VVIACAEGQRVRVLSAADEHGDTDWSHVAYDDPEFGEVAGYVPSSYLEAQEPFLTPTVCHVICPCSM
jgi:hypothetical protein